MAESSLRQRTGACSLLGPRQTNQDAFELRDRTLEGTPTLAVLVVADGMGGMEAGDLASKVAVSQAMAVLDDNGAAPGVLEDAFAAAHEGIQEMARTHGLGGTGTTLTIALVTETEAIVGHVGDTRAYMLHALGLTQITEDHSKVGRMLRDGILTEEQAMAHPEQNVLERALGAGAMPEVDIYRVGIGPGDTLLLSSDGLHGVLPRDELESELATTSSLQDACDRLASMAELRGSQDNITAVAWQYPGGTPRPQTAVRVDLGFTGPRPHSEGARRHAAPAQDTEVTALLLLLAGCFGFGLIAGFLFMVTR